MPSYQAPVKDMKFVLEELLNIYQYRGKVASFESLDSDIVDAILGEAGRLTEEVVAPTNIIGDEEGCRFSNGEVFTPEVYKDVYKQWCEGGWNSIGLPTEYGGQGMPYVLTIAVNEMLSAANQAFAMFPGLTNSAIMAIETWASDELKAKYLPKMVSGHWTGTMNLTESHCGTDLGLLRTKAEPVGDGSYKITGTKIFISAGEQDLTENIIHLVLARLPDAPGGVKGISLFLVPKFMVHEDGSLGKRNGVMAGNIEKKMGIKSSPTCVMNFDGGIGWLVGAPNKGLQAMFTMMNEARIGVALQGLAQSEVAFQNAAHYANHRTQGRALTGTVATDKQADPIIVHPDVRRMLLTVRSFNEGARAMLMETALRADLAHGLDDEDVVKEHDDYLALMTPILKGYFTDQGFANTNESLQVFGGHGYIHEWGMEQFLRDARIAQIYEGANGVQALDLIGRKLPQGFGRLLRRFFHPLSEWLEQNAMNPKMKDYAMPLMRAFTKLQQATGYVAEKGMVNPNDAAAGSVHFMHMFGIVAVGYQWVKIAQIAHAKLAEGTDDPAFYRDKLTLAKFYMEQYLPDVSALLGKIQSGSETMMHMDADRFHVA